MKRRVLTLIAFLLLIGTLSLVLGRHLSVEALAEKEHRLRAMIAHAPVVSLLVGFLIYVAAALVPGTTGKSIIFGWLFGFWAGLALVNCGLTAAALIAFFFVRYVFYDAISARLGRFARRIDQAVRRDGAVYLLMLRLLHVPYTLTNYAAGATDVRARTFWWTTHVGLLPGNFVFVLAGAQLPSLETVAHQGVQNLIDLPLLIALMLLAFLPIGIRTAMRYWRSKQILPAEDSDRSRAGQ